jgi:hypothetical protein
MSHDEGEVIAYGLGRGKKWFGSATVFTRIKPSPAGIFSSTRAGVFQK